MLETGIAGDVRRTRVVFTGAHSTGKTTLVEALHDHLRRSTSAAVGVIKETAREVAARGFPIHHESKLETYVALLESHVAKEIATRTQSVLLDRFIPDYAAYATVHGNCSPECLRLMKHCHSLMSQALGYHHVIYLPIEFPVVDDGKRLTTAGYQKEIDAALCQILAEWGQTYVEIRGDLPTRLAAVCRAIGIDTPPSAAPEPVARPR